MDVWLLQRAAGYCIVSRVVCWLIGWQRLTMILYIYGMKWYGCRCHCNCNCHCRCLFSEQRLLMAARGSTVLQICNCQFTFSLTERPALWNQKKEKKVTKQDGAWFNTKQRRSRLLTYCYLLGGWTSGAIVSSVSPRRLSAQLRYDYLACRHLARQVFNPLK